MIFCNTCVLPNTRPNLFLNKFGICNACLEVENKKKIKWNERQKLLKKIIDRSKKRSNGYDCIIPVSGGKDSTWQVLKILKLGLNPLAITWKTPARTKIGQENLNNLIKLGVDHIDYQVNPKVESKFMLESFKKKGSTAIPMHLALFNIPINLAVNLSIPLIVWGENSAQEYGGDAKSINDFILSKDWFEKYGVTNGTKAENWISRNINKKNLTPYRNNNWNLIKKNKIMSIFLGHFIKWDTKITYEMSKKYGFKERKQGPKVGYYNYADIDCDFISIHHWLKWYKFGFSRMMDNLSVEIRNNRITRDKAIKIIERAGDQTPHDDIIKFCKFVDIDIKSFFKIAETHRNKKIWKKINGRWVLKNFIVNNYFK